MMTSRKRWLGVAAAAGVSVLLVWAFLEGRHEMAKERERERPIKVPPRVSRTARDAVVVTLDQETQTRLGLTSLAIPSTVTERAMQEHGHFAEADSGTFPSTTVPSLPLAFAVLDAEYERLPSAHETNVDDLSRLSPVATITPQANTSQLLTGVVVPRTAVVYAEGKTWAYVQTRADTFMRREVHLDHLTQDGWFVTSGLAASERVVVTGAQILLSEELKSQIQILEDEHN